MNKKYEFVEGDEVTTPSGATLKSIRALIAIADTAFMPAVNPGDLGGYIQSEANLSETGTETSATATAFPLGVLNEIY